MIPPPPDDAPARGGTTTGSPRDHLTAATDELFSGVDESVWDDLLSPGLGQSRHALAEPSRFAAANPS